MNLLEKAKTITTPTAYSNGFVHSVKPEVSPYADFTFSRGSNLAATRVDENGLIEKGRENLFTYSNEFTNSAWNSFSNGLTRTASNITDPDGGTNAWEITTTATNEHHRLGHTMTSGKVKTISFYAKANGYEYVRVWAFSGGNTNSNYFHLSGEGATGGNGQLNIKSIESVGNGWYRCQCVLDPNNNVVVVISPAPDASTASGTSTYLADGTSGIYLYHAQLEAGLIATDYIESGASTGKAGLLEDEPRFDYSGGATCPSLLLEPSRTNLIGYSEYLDGWNIFGSGLVTLTPNQIISPEGIQNAYLLETSTNNRGVYAYGGSLSTGDVVTASVYLKQKVGGSSIVSFGTSSTAFGGDKASRFDLSDGTIQYENPNNDSVSIEPVGNGWYRCIVSDAATASGPAAFIIYSYLDGNANCDFYIYGAQTEAGSYPTSYIPCYGAATTRSGDVCNNAGNSDLFDSEGVLYAEIAALADDGTLRELTISDGTTNNRVIISYDTFDRIRLKYRNAGVNVFDEAYEAEIKNFNKIAIRYRENEFSFWLNGFKIFLDTNGSVVPSNTFTELSYDSGDDSFPMYSRSKMVATFPYLSDSEMACLTNNPDSPFGPFYPFEQRVLADGATIEGFTCMIDDILAFPQSDLGRQLFDAYDARCEAASGDTEARVCTINELNDLL